jgi:HAD superfamily hydrolase (TIGR01509 family)
MPTAFDAVIFDCDGVLVDSEPINGRVLADMLRRSGFTMTPQEVTSQFAGHPLGQIKEFVELLLEQNLPADWQRECLSRQHAALNNELEAVQHVESVLQYLKGRNTPVAVASGGEREGLLLKLRRVGLEAYFDRFVFSGSDVLRTKPAPDVYLLAAKALGASPARCAVIEDSPTGVRAGVAAGMTVFAYSPNGRAQGLRDAGARHVFTWMMQLPSLLGYPLWTPPSTHAR